MTQYEIREILCSCLVKIIYFGRLTPEQEKTLHRLYNNLQMENSLEGYIS